MRVLSVVPPGGWGLNSPVLGIAYVSSVLEKEGVDVSILDTRALQLKPTDIKSEIARLHPDIVAVTSTTSTFPSALQVATITKEIDKDILVVFGGVHATFEFQNILQGNSPVDTVVRYEGEYTMAELVNTLSTDGKMEKVEGLAYKQDDCVKVTPDRRRIDNLDELPFPARHMLPMNKYLNKGAMITTRGCPFSCAFCSASALHGRKIRALSTSKVIEEAELLVKKYHPKWIFFQDDLFTYSRKRVLEIGNKMVERGLDTEWGCITRVDMVDRELLREMAKAGCKRIFYGIESGSQSILDRIGKGFAVEAATKAIRWTREAGITIFGSFVLGLPGETIETALETLRFIKDNPPDVLYVNPFTPFPGTPIFKDPKLFGIRILHKDWNEYGLVMPVAETVDLKRRDIVGLRLRFLDEFSDLMGLKETHRMLVEIE